MHDNVLKWSTNQIGIATLPVCRRARSPLFALAAFSRHLTLEYSLNLQVSSFIELQYIQPFHLLEARERGMANTPMYDQAGTPMTDQNDHSKSAALKEDGNTLYRQGKVLEGMSNV